MAGDGLMAEYEEQFSQSRELFARECKVLPGGLAHDSRFHEPFPVYFKRAAGAYKWTVEGHRLIDFNMGHGALLFGHNHPRIMAAVQSALTEGTHFGGPHETEIAWAEKICQLVPSAERVRFTNSGTEATLLALRLARAFTGRIRILKLQGHFHGWHDEATVGTRVPLDRPASSGVGPGAMLQVVALPTDVTVLEAALATKEYAAIILEPTGASWGTVPLPEQFLPIIRRLTRVTGTLLIFDEVISGFRLAPGGAQQLAEVVPDLTCLAKILAGGLPGGAVAGRQDILEQMDLGREMNRLPRVAHQGTFNANPLAAAAGTAALELASSGIAQRAADDLAESLRTRLNALLQKRGVPGLIYGSSSFFHIYLGRDCPLTRELKSLSYEDVTQLLKGMSGLGALRRSLYVEGIDLLRNGGFLSTAHTPEDVEETVKAFARVIDRLKL